MRSALVCLWVCASAAPAHAFPELALREGTPCVGCHVAPGGGGALTSMGREEAADSLSRGGDGRALHGAVELPDWLITGGDLRVAGLVLHDRDETEGLELAAFPMQADLRLGVSHGGVTVIATGGLRGSTRVYDRSDRSYFVSTEHYAMYAGETLYARIGKFFPVQGLRLPDHTLYVRRFTGTNLYEEPYAIGAGATTGSWEVHATAFVHDPVLDVGRREAGGVLHGEWHAGAATLAASARVGVGGDGLRAIGGVSPRVKLASGTIALVEVDAIRDQVEGAAGVTQLAALAGIDQRVARGVQLFGWYEHFEAALGLAPSYHHAAGLALKLYPRAHWEIVAHSRWQRIGTAIVGLGMLQLHYYL